MFPGILWAGGVFWPWNCRFAAGCCGLGVIRGRLVGGAWALWWLRSLRGSGSACSAHSGDGWFVVFGGGVAVLWPGAFLVCGVFGNSSET